MVLLQLPTLAGALILCAVLIITFAVLSCCLASGVWGCQTPFSAKRVALYCGGFFAIILLKRKGHYENFV